MTQRRQGWIVPAHEARTRTLLACVLVTALGLFAAWNARFFSDDGAILWRYAEHLSAGHGIRYNLEDAPIEGSSNLPYTALLAVIFACGVDAETASLALALVVGALAFAWTYLLARRAGLPGWAAFAALAALAVNHSWAAWTTGGLDMRFSTWLTLVALARVLREEREPSRRRVIGGIALGAIAVTRPEGFLFFGLVLAWRLLAAARRFQLAAFVAGFALVKLAQLGFELAYFHDWLPNTAHAKVTGLWLGYGGLWIARFAGVYLLPLTFGVAVLGAVQPRRRAEPLRFLLWISAGYLAALVAIGGERFEFRLADAVLPLLYVAAAGGAALVLERWLHKRPELLRQGRALALAWIALPSASGYALRQLPFVFDENFERVEFTGEFYAKQKRAGRLLREHFPPDTRIAIGAAGAVPYWSGLYTLDIHGLNDRIVARRPPDEGRPLWHQKHATEEDRARARIDLFDLWFYDEHPALFLAARQSLPVDVRALSLDPDAMPPEIAAYVPPNLPSAFCVRLGDTTYMHCKTRGDAERYRRYFRERGVPVLF